MTPTRPLSSIKEIIVHCSATPEGRDVHIGEIRRWHIARGFQDVGYHYVIALDGTIELGRPLDRDGAHCTGHNAISVGICYVGGLAADGHTPKDTRTAAQRKALAECIALIRRRVGKPRLPVFGHRDFAAKACPCFDARKEYN